jgi:hypothetical protein
MAEKSLGPIDSSADSDAEPTDEEFMAILKPDKSKDFRLPLIIWSAVGVLACWLGFKALLFIFSEAMTPTAAALVLGLVALAKTGVLGTVAILTGPDATIRRRTTVWIWTLAACSGSVGCLWAAFRYSANGWLLLAGFGTIFLVFLTALMKNADEHLSITWLTCSLALEAGLIIMLVGPA